MKEFNPNPYRSTLDKVLVSLKEDWILAKDFKEYETKIVMRAIGSHVPLLAFIPYILCAITLQDDLRQDIERWQKVLLQFYNYDSIQPWKNKI